MIWFKDEKSEHLKKLLKHSQSQFRFDQSGIKNRLLTSLDTAKIELNHDHFIVFRIVKYSVVPVCLFLFISASFAFASSSVPGDKLFFLNKLGEKIILNLPLSSQQNADIESKIVE